MEVITFDEKYINDANQIWNEVVAEGVAFPQEDELKTKSARLIELNAELDIEKQTQTVPVEEKAEKPSILARLQSQRNQPAVSNPNKNLKKEEVL